MVSVEAAQHAGAVQSKKSTFELISMQVEMKRGNKSATKTEKNKKNLHEFTLEF